MTAGPSPIPPSPAPTFDDDIYEKLIEHPNDLRGLLAYGLFRQSERDWAKRFYEKEGRPPTDRDLATFYFSYDDGDIERLRTQAERDMLNFAFAIVDDQRPEIEEAARKSARDDQLDEIRRELRKSGSLFRSVWAGIISSFVFAVITLAFVAIYFGPLGLHDITRAMGR